MYKIDSRILGMVGTNCYLLCNMDIKECVVIDTADKPEEISRMIEESGCRLKGILLTHGHFDHIMAADAIRDKYDVKVTFFMTGGWIESYPEDVKSILAHGHDLGNHSEKHKHMSTISMRECEEELMGPHKKVQELTGYDMFLFRPPYGDYNNTLIEAADECGYYTIQWSVDSLDWKDYGADNIVKTVLNHKNLKDGAIILMHNGAKYTKDALPRIIEGLKEKGYEIVPVSQIIYTDNYEINHAGEQIKK